MILLVVDTQKGCFDERLYLFETVRKDIKQLMSVEGDVWARFYSEFKNFLPEDFVLNKRVKTLEEKWNRKIIGNFLKNKKGIL